jgi:hypothetical protein
MNTTTNTWIEPPPQKEGSGCFGKGCLILAIFLFLLMVACAAGIYWGFHTQSAIGRSIFWLTKIRAVSETPGMVPMFRASDTEIEEVESRWQKFEEASHEGQPARIELTGRDLNMLLATHPDSAGKIFASVEGNRLRFQVSLPLQKFLGRPGHYFNADIMVESDGPQSFEHVQLNRVEVNHKPLPDDLLEWKFKSRAFREYLSDYTNVYRKGSFEIRDGKLILRSGGAD